MNEDSLDFAGLHILKPDAETERYINEQEKIAERQAAADRKQRLENWYVSADSGIRPRFYNASFENYETETEEEKRNLKTCLEFTQAKGCRILLLYGQNGNGKTHLASSVIRTLGGVYTTSAMLCLEFESGADFNAKRNKLDVVKYYSTRDVLVIDEIGRNVNQDTEKRLLPLIIGNIYDNNGKVVLVTNAEKKDFLEEMGKAIFDRFTEVCYSCEFTENSRRKELRK